MPHTSSQTFLRELDKKGAQASCLFLYNEKATGKMPVLHYKITSTGKLIDDALEAVETENPRNGDLRIASSSFPRMAIGTSPPPEGTPQLVSEASDKNANFA